jgi:hypothetical protein
MIQPGVYNIKLQRRADYSVELQFRDSDKVPLDLTGWQVAAQAWDPARTTKHADFTIEYIDRYNGRVRLKLSYVQTASFPRELVYDVLLINPQGEREYYIEGSIATSEGYTEVAA